jgi:trimethylamine--corrinoid protein Co-methyltransferase
MSVMTALRSRRSADRANSRTGAAIPQLPARTVRNPYPPMQLLSADQIEAIHAASLHILENFGIELMSTRALDLFERAGASIAVSSSRR